MEKKKKKKKKDKKNLAELFTKSESEENLSLLLRGQKNFFEVKRPVFT